MSLIGSLIPGVREVRAPLISGYLWCIFVWLVIASHVPTDQGQAVYEHLVDLWTATGPVGQALAVSIVAYLFGSLVQSASTKLREGIDTELAKFINDPRVRVGDFDSSSVVDSLDRIVSVADPADFEVNPALLGKLTPTIAESIVEMTDRELGESFRQIQRAVEVGKSRRSDPAASYFSSGGAPMVRLRIQADDGLIADSEFVIPRVAMRDLVERRSLLETRLLEAAPVPGAKIERLRAEAEFRLAIALPLAFLAILLSLDVSPFWILGLMVPAALIAQGRQLSNQAANEFFDASRARAQTDELERITPIYERYRTQASRLVEAIGRAR